MNKTNITLYLVILTIGCFITFSIYLTINPKTNYAVKQNFSKVEVILSEKPYFHYIGLDQPYYYNLEAINYSNSFRISDFVYDLVKDNDSISRAIKNLNYSDTIVIDIDSSSFNKLNKTKDNIEILGLSIKNNVLIDTAKIGKYQKQGIADKVFSFFVISVILFFIFKKQIKAKKGEE
jgi:hypothetical protein